MEGLKTADRTRAAKKTVEEPGANVRWKAGFHRAILATGWSGVQATIGCRAARFVVVNAAHPGRTCAECGAVDADTRPLQATLKCVARGHVDHAELNAARDIRRRRPAYLRGARSVAAGHSGGS